MTFLQAVILGIIQGITEFLPISSSGHLVIIPYLLGWKLPDNQVFIFDVLIQLATLMALIVFYWKDLTQISHAMIQEIRSKKLFVDKKARTGWLTLIANIPAGIAGLTYKENIENAFTSPATVGAFLIITALLMAVSEKIGKKNKRLSKLNWFDSILIGASGAVFGILTAYAFLYPNNKLIIFPLPIPISAKYIAAGLIVLSVILGLTNPFQDNVAYFGHLGGIIVGLIFMYAWKAKKDQKPIEERTFEFFWE